MRIEVDGGTPQSYQTFQVTICNSPFCALHLQLAPDILMDDGLLDVVVYQQLSKFAYLCPPHPWRWEGCAWAAGRCVRMQIRVQCGGHFFCWTGSQREHLQKK
jgi:hypothetical protein